MKVDGKFMVVTGGGAGIGRQVVLELLRRGALVAAVDLRSDGRRAFFMGNALVVGVVERIGKELARDRRADQSTV
jgi:NAD(P)-dependent dehydrogenase (short-subunit alcohol dehydrogenase family)